MTRSRILLAAVAAAIGLYVAVAYVLPDLSVAGAVILIAYVAFGAAYAYRSRRG